ncbi:uncharacterized protein [Heptranchias perlo]|uniref:uncharacterized protein n=1 Tax=Heptranchias perlo TaxID=212740 RepID=UPI00355941A9
MAHPRGKAAPRFSDFALQLHLEGEKRCKNARERARTRGGPPHVLVLTDAEVEALDISGTQHCLSMADGESGAAETAASVIDLIEDLSSFSSQNSKVFSPSTDPTLRLTWSTARGWEQCRCNTAGAGGTGSPRVRIEPAGPGVPESGSSRRDRESPSPDRAGGTGSPRVRIEPAGPGVPESGSSRRDRESPSPDRAGGTGSPRVRIEPAGPGVPESGSSRRDRESPSPDRAGGTGSPRVRIEPAGPGVPESGSSRRDRESPSPDRAGGTGSPRVRIEPADVPVHCVPEPELLSKTEPGNICNSQRAIGRGFDRLVTHHWETKVEPRAGEIRKPSNRSSNLHPDQFSTMEPADSEGAPNTSFPYTSAASACRGESDNCGATSRSGTPKGTKRNLSAEFTGRKKRKEPAFSPDMPEEDYKLWQNLNEWEERTKKVVEEICENLENVNYVDSDEKELLDSLKRKTLKLKDKCLRENMYIGAFGQTGAGKSSLVNAVLHERGLLPTSSSGACTSAVVKVQSAGGRKFKAEIEFLTEEEWNEELKVLVKLCEKEENSDTDDDEDGDTKEFEMAEKKLKTVYGDCGLGKSHEELLKMKIYREIPKNNKKSLSEDTVST